MKNFKIIILLLLVVLGSRVVSADYSETATDSVTVTVTPLPQTIDIRVDDSSIDCDSSTTLHIKTEANSTDCTLGWDTGYETLSPNSSYDRSTGNLKTTTSYTVACDTHGEDAVSDSVTVNVAACPVTSCPAPLTQTVKVACDAKEGMTLVSGEVTRLQTKEVPACTFGSPVTTSNSTYVSDNCVYQANTCGAPTTRNVQVACDLNSSGEAAISGSVTRSQEKVAPSCTFGEPVTVSNSTYVSDNCVYPPSTCPAPTTRNVQVACDLNSSGEAAISGSVTRSQEKVAPSCTFGEPVTVSNSTYVSDNCVYPESSSNSCWNGAANYPTCTTDGSGKCLNGAKNPPVCTTDGTGKCLNGAINPPTCDNFFVPVASNPQVMNMDVTYQGKSIRSGNTTSKVPYNSKVGVSWSSSDAVSCTLYSSDAKSGQVSLISSLNNKATPYFSPGLKKDTTYTVTCRGGDGNQKSDSVKVLVSPISAGYIEQ